MTKTEMSELALRMGISKADMRRARVARALPCVGRMTGEQLQAMGLNPAAVDVVLKRGVAAAADAGGDVLPPSMHGVSDGVSLSGMQVYAKKAVDRFYSLLAPLDAFSTTYREDFVVMGRPGVLPRVVIPIYSDEGGCEVDNYDSFATRTDSGTVTDAEVELHKVDKVITIYGRDIEQGVDVEKRVESALNALAIDVQKVVFDHMKVGTAQGDDAAKTVAAMEIPPCGAGDGAFNFGYANRVLTEVIQPRVHALLVDSEHYGQLKPADRESLTAADLDVDAVHKVQDTASLGAGVVGLLANRRGAGIGLAAPYMMPGAYASYEQFTHNGQEAPIACCTWYEPNENCLKIWFGILVGVAVTDASAIVPLVEAAVDAEP